MRLDRFILFALAVTACALAASALADQTADAPANNFMNIIKSSYGNVKHAISAGGHKIGEAVDKLRAEAFKVFMRVYNKSYGPGEIMKRMNLFARRHKLIEETKKAFLEGKSSFVLRENAFADFDEKELSELTGVIPRDELQMHMSNDQEPADRGYNIYDTAIKPSKRRPDLPAHKDWRESGCVAPPRTQHPCSGCYAISVLGVLETMRCLKRPELGVTPLSPQQVIDCTRVYKLNGCQGGWPTRVLDYLQEAAVISTEQCYGFERRQGECRLGYVYNQPGCVVNLFENNARLKFSIMYDEDAMMEHVATKGPIVSLIRTTEKFMLYANGVFDDPVCTGGLNEVTHAIQIVGYGTDAATGLDYWLIKNSWGTEGWGENGYGRVARGKNACSIGLWGWSVDNS